MEETPPANPQPAMPPLPEKFIIAPDALRNPEQKRNASYGALISIVIIIAIVVVGAFYSWGSRVAQDQIPASLPLGTTTAQ